MKKNLSLLCLVAMLFEVHTAFAGDVKTEKVTLVGKQLHQQQVLKLKVL